MKFSSKDIGKKIIILNTLGCTFISVGKEYTIRNVSEDGGAHFHNCDYYWYAHCSDDFKYLIDENTDIEIGDWIVVTQSTTTFKKGDERLVIGFLCDDKNKIIIEGTLPGGWVDYTKLCKKIDFSKTRIKKGIELIEEYGIQFMSSHFFSKSIAGYLGRNLIDLSVKQAGKDIVVDESTIIASRLLTTKPYEPKILLITSDPKKIEAQNNEEKQKILGRKFSDFSRCNEENENSMVTLSCTFSANGYIKVGNSLLTGEPFKVVKKSDYESKNEANNTSSPF